MSDSITSCIKYLNSDGTINRYEVTFSFADLELTPDMATAIILISGNILANPLDLIEVKIKACERASAIKKSYSLATSISDLNGPVTL